MSPKYIILTMKAVLAMAFIWKLGEGLSSFTTFCQKHRVNNQSSSRLVKQ